MSLKNLAEKMVPAKVTYEGIQNCRNMPQTLHIRTFDNKIFVRYGLRGERRHVEIIEQLLDMVDAGYKLPSVEFKYYTMDTVYLQDVGTTNGGAVFTFWNDEKYDDIPYRVLAPSSFFSGYCSGKFMRDSPRVSYQDEMDRIIKFTEEKTMPFSEKENTLIFKGKTSYPYRQRLFKEIKEKISSVSEFLLHERGLNENLQGNSEYQNPIENLGRFKYQLITDGAPRGKTPRRSGTCRAKYMLATGSILIYITERGHKKEWWQYSPEIKNVIQYCETVDEAIEKIRWLEDNPEVAHEISVKGLHFVKNFLHKKNVLEYWYQLLTVYEKRCNFKIEKPDGRWIQSRDDVWSVDD